MGAAAPEVFIVRDTFLGMSERAEKLLSEALKLPTPDRARLASELIASVDGAADADVESTWAAEIERRIRRVQTSGAQGSDWQTAHARIEGRIRRK